MNTAKNTRIHWALCQDAFGTPTNAPTRDCRPRPGAVVTGEVTVRSSRYGHTAGPTGRWRCRRPAPVDVPVQGGRSDRIGSLFDSACPTAATPDTGLAERLPGEPGSPVNRSARPFARCLPPFNASNPRRTSAADVPASQPYAAAMLASRVSCASMSYSGRAL